VAFQSTPLERLDPTARDCCSAPGGQCVTVGETAGLSAKGQLIDVYAGLPLLVRTSREAAAAPSFCSPGEATVGSHDAATTGGCVIGTTRGLTSIATPARRERRPSARRASEETCRRDPGRPAIAACLWQADLGSGVRADSIQAIAHEPCSARGCSLKLAENQRPAQLQELKESTAPGQSLRWVKAVRRSTMRRAWPRPARAVDSAWCPSPASRARAPRRSRRCTAGNRSSSSAWVSRRCATW